MSDNNSTWVNSRCYETYSTQSNDDLTLTCVMTDLIRFKSFDDGIFTTSLFGNTSNISLGLAYPFSPAITPTVRNKIRKYNNTHGIMCVSNDKFQMIFFPEFLTAFQGLRRVPPSNIYTSVRKTPYRYNYCVVTQKGNTTKYTMQRIRRLRGHNTKSIYFFFFFSIFD